MSHPRDLIQRICTMLEREYNPALYRYVIESRIAGTRMLPDVQILQANGAVVCVVEIGYTRPEKLTAYRRTLRIPDVRWYDKSGHLHGDVNVVVKQVELQVTMRPVREMYVYDVRTAIPCESDECLEEYGPDGEDDEGYLLVDVETTVVTDRVKVFFPSFCDKCGGSWLAETTESGLGEDLRVLTPQEFGGRYGSRRMMAWDIACAEVVERYGLTLDYSEGPFLFDHHAAESRRIVEDERLSIVRPRHRKWGAA